MIARFRSLTISIIRGPLQNGQLNLFKIINKVDGIVLKNMRWETYEIALIVGALMNTLMTSYLTR